MSLKRARSTSPVDDPDSSLTDASSPDMSTASVAIGRISSAAAYCDSAITRLEGSSSAGTAHVIDAVSTLTVAVQQSVPAFVYAARDHADAVDKLLEMRVDELGDTIKSVQACLQQTYTATLGLGDVEASFKIVRQLVDETDCFFPVAMFVMHASRDLVQPVADSSHVVIGIDSARSTVSHEKWLTRSETNLVDIALVGEAVYGVTPVDVFVSVGKEYVGWSLSAVSVEMNTVRLDVHLTSDCSDSATLCVNIGGSPLTIPLKAAASPGTVAAVVAECKRVGDLCFIDDRVVTVAEVTSLLTASTAALSSPEVAAALCDAVFHICVYSRSAEDNRVICGAAGVIPAVVSAMSTHGAVDADVSIHGCNAMISLADGNTVNADSIVLSSGGLDLILSLMISHAGNGGVQGRACAALYFIADAVSPAAKRVMCESAAVEVINTAKRNHASHRDVQTYADVALAALRA